MILSHALILLVPQLKNSKWWRHKLGHSDERGVWTLECLLWGPHERAPLVWYPHQSHYLKNTLIFGAYGLFSWDIENNN